MCIADLYTYPPSMREAVARADGATLDLLPRGNPASPPLGEAASPIPLAGALCPLVDPPATNRDVPAIPLIDTHHGIPRVRTNRERIAAWRNRYANVPVELTL